ncbi:hypothetical protein Avbf_17602 [Armadillidium vulgare]|nr:hypothetical protein Avbf_17602 [Armadillidium vulgare]
MKLLLGSQIVMFVLNALVHFNSCYYDLKLNLTVRSNIMNRNVKLAMKNINQKKVIKWYVKEID